MVGLTQSVLEIENTISKSPRRDPSFVLWMVATVDVWAVVDGVMSALTVVTMYRDYMFILSSMIIHQS